MTEAVPKNEPASNGGTQENMAISHLTMRRAMGSLGIGLPFALAMGSLCIGDSIGPTISDYYHSKNPILSGLFVGILFATGVFLICYKGYSQRVWKFLKDSELTTIAGFGALGIALLPAASKSSPECCMWMESELDVGHTVFTLLFFVFSCAIIGCLFTRTSNAWHRAFYWFCTSLIAASITTLIIRYFYDGLFPKDFGSSIWMFVIETIAVCAFGAAWIAKGHTLAGIRSVRIPWVGTK